MVEFALVLPILMLVVVGIFKFGVVFNNYLQLTDAVRAGARQLAVERGQAAPCTDATNTVLTATGLSGITVTFPFPAGDQSTCTNLVSGEPATVTATYPTCDLTILGINFAPGCKLTATATERIE